MSESLDERWERIGNDGAEYIKFDRVEVKRSSRPDLHAFLLLDEMFPGTTDMISGAEHDEIYLAIDEDEAATLTDDQILELIRCGVRCGEYGLCMFA